MRIGAGVALLSCIAMGASQAADYSPPPAPVYTPPPAASSDWTMTLGVEGRMLPEYEGSGDFRFVALPLFGLRRAGTPPHFRSPRDGFGFGIIDTGNFRVGPTFKLRIGRKEGDSPDLVGLGDVDWTLEAGAFAEYWPSQWLRTRVELRQGFGGHDGQVADLLADLVMPVTPQLTLSGGPRMTLATSAATSPYFSVDAAQSAASGLPVYDAGGGIRSYGAGVQARYQWTPKWATHVFLEYERLSGDVADSPLVTLRGSPDQIQVGVGATYSFDIKGLW